ncbi:MAG: serine hydrolase [Nitrosomonas sp.]|nr:MAG: serine hydrolase [Nitrosomonas sp.]
MLNNNLILFLGGVFLIVATASAQSSTDFSFPADSEIRQIILDRIENRKQSMGIVVGLVKAGERRFVANGLLDTDDRRLVNADTVFEIGSITKVFTGFLLADMIQRSEVKLDDPIAKYLPEEVVVPRRNGKEITLLELVTHTSGLPRMPDNFLPADTANPYPEYSVKQLYQFISNYQLSRDIGTEWEYSNLGYGLLGQGLERRKGTDYETLIQERILKPLGMSNTAIILSPKMEARLAIGHNLALETVKDRDSKALVGAGAFRSTASDLLTFLEMSLGINKSPLTSVVATTLAIRKPIGGNNEMGLGWLIMKNGEDEMIWHTGLTAGYTSFIGFLMKKKVGVVVLSNTSASIEDIGKHLLNPEIPLSPTLNQNIAITIDTNLYDAYVGRYRFNPDYILSVTREGDRLFMQANAYEKIEIFPKGEREFFSKAVETQIIFKLNDKGRAVSFTHYQNGGNAELYRIEE